MPPKVVKRGAAAKKASISSKTATQNQKQEPVKNHEEIPVADIAAEENPIKTVPNGLAAVENNVEEVKDSIDEYEKDEHLDLEDNYHESDPDEDVGDDYDEGENELEDDQEVGDEVEEELEEIVDEEEEEIEEIVDEDIDTGDEEVEYVYEEVEGDDDDAVAAAAAAGGDDDAVAAAGDDDDHAGMEKEHKHLADVKKEEQGEVRKERKKQEEFEVFVGGLDKNATEHDLRKIFGKVGKITEARLMMNPQTKRNKGFALLSFETAEQVKRALAELKNPVINGKLCGITPCQNSDTLYLDNICKTWKKEALKEKLKHYEVESFKDLTLVEDGNKEGTNCGFALLEFSSRSDAKEAYKRLKKTDVVFGVDKPAEVSFADSFDDLKDDIMAQVKTVFIDLLSPSWDEDYVRGLLKKYGEVEKVELAKNRPTARRKNYGFVTFAMHAAAVKCAESITRAGLGEGNKKVKVRARLFRPLQKVRGKHVTRSDVSGRKLGRSARPSGSRSSLRSRLTLRSRLGPPIRPTLQSRLGPPSRSTRAARRLGNSIPPVRPSSARNRRPVATVPVRARPATPPSRSYERRLTAAYPKGSMKRDYGRPVDMPPPRSRVPEDYGSQVPSQRRSSYRDYPARDSGYSDLHRSASRTAQRRGHLDDSFDRRLERSPPPHPPPHLSYREGRPRDYDTLSGSKRPYATIDDIPPRYADVDARQSRSRLNYDYGGSVSEYKETYGDRLGRSSLGYNSGSRSSISTQNSHGAYSSRQDMSYGRGSIGGNDGGIYSSSYGGDYISRGSDAGGSSYPSMYSSRSMNGSSSYMGSGGGSRSYY